MSSEVAADDESIEQVNELVPNVSRVVEPVPGAGPAIDDVVGRVAPTVGEAEAFVQTPVVPALPPLPLRFPVVASPTPGAGLTPAPGSTFVPCRHRRR